MPGTGTADFAAGRARRWKPLASGGRALLHKFNGETRLALPLEGPSL
jgi:hypothetical protein